LSSVYSLGIDNLVIELSGSVCPTVENCANEYLSALEKLVVEQSAEKIYWKYALDKPTLILHNNPNKPDSLVVSCSDSFRIRYSAYYPHKTVEGQYAIFDVCTNNYKTMIMDARSPAFLPRWLLGSLFLYLGNKGLHGVNEKNHLLIKSNSASSYINNLIYGVRYNGQEFVRHKVLDVIGTLALTGRQFINTEFRFIMTGHKFDLYALKSLFEQQVFASCTVD
ncbi:MAG: UDP-3-O-acyl-N-acetylglucosamine deacetylase, partial [Candidatus Woesearchaeota archaeon]